MGEREWQRRVIVGVSGSLGSLAALHRGAEEARRTGAELVAVLVWAPQGALLGACREAAVERLGGAMAEAFPLGLADVPLQGLAVRGEAGAALVALADGPDDVLIVGCGERHWWRRGHLSVSGYCVRHAGCPVLTVPRPQLQRELAVLARRNACHLPVAPVVPVGGGVSRSGRSR
ncbi:universal stress protein [Kitasatospora sp. LaBMicrA B282]|uniref:universal stress protein n=1 Tax=Kitasatospora sp. LaBMicrA B282 TaxID=3420949 RepID=UPI003D118848